MIGYGLRLGWSNGRIAKTIKRDPSTISKEISRNGSREKYRYGKSQKRYQELKKASKKKYRKLENDREMQKKVVGFLGKYLSPEQIAGRLRTEDITICHETIYQWIYRDRRELQKSGYAKASLLHEVSAPILQEKTKNIFERIPRKKRHTITYDRGKEFGEQDDILEKFTKTTVYRAHPYASWERGCNEN